MVTFFLNFIFTQSHTFTLLLKQSNRRRAEQGRCIFQPGHHLTWCSAAVVTAAAAADDDDDVVDDVMTL